MDKKCRDFFNQDYCFVECSPYLGPWLVHSERSLGLERVYKVPLCQTDCDAWYDACKTSMTCAENWQSGGFNWTTGTNKCKKGFTCMPIGEVYKTAKDFCEKVWDHSWKVIADGKHNWSTTQPQCMHLGGDAVDTNNRAVAKLYATAIIQRLRSVASSPFVTGSSAILPLLLAESLRWAQLL
nr:unnamed protein product [Spirometra erinaceieuropaei]